MEYQLILSTTSDAFKQQIIELYIHTFSSEPTFQYLPKNESEEYIKTLISKGFGFVAVEKNHVAGVVLACSLSPHFQLHESIADSIYPTKTIYIAELMVDENYRSRGIGKKLIVQCLEHAVNTNYSDVLIRVWDQNHQALALYQKMGFNIVNSIVQHKMKADKSGLNHFRKLYLHKKISF